MDSLIRIARETEFYQGYIRFKMSVSNEGPYVITEVALDFNFDDELLKIDRHEPGYAVKKEKFILGNIDGSKSKSIAIYFDPLMCSGGTDINCLVTYKDYQGNLEIARMEAKEICFTCPIMQTESDINIGRLKEFIEKLPSRDSRVYEIRSGFDIRKLANLAREVIEKRDVRHIRTLHTRDGMACEIWYYGKTKVKKDDIVIRVSILTEHQTVELFAATQAAEALTGLLADLGRDLKQTLESRANGMDRVVNLAIRNSVVQRSNLLDMCNLDGTCDVNIVIEDSVVQRSGIATGAEEARLLEEQEKPEEPERLDQEKCTLSEREGIEKHRTEEKGLKLEQKEQEKLQKADHANSIGMLFMPIPSGEFIMGSNESSFEKPVHEVTISKPFYLGKYPVTQREWVAVMGSNPSYFKGDDMPVESVSWEDAQEFIKKLNAMEDTTKYRLPSEVEWEYACRAGTTTRYACGDNESVLDEYAWYSANSGRQTHPVGQKKANLWGLYDMHGNVWEWVQDNWDDTYEGAPTDGSAWQKNVNSRADKDQGIFSNIFGSNEKQVDFSSYRVLRGGSWNVYAEYCRSAYRNNLDPKFSYYYLGFRLLMEV
ncbi:formylglycine-generating enzyme family protein [Methanomethylovorans sp.]|uniref:formylglycine-generating enzyme family protein n=1 Tax=Methanomethylovorans sp. TaxID=2758717 RepID=UPI00351C5899